MRRTFADYKLSKQECAVAQHLCLGKDNANIAHALNLSESTVKMHIRSIMAATGCTNRTQVAVLFAGVSAADLAAAQAENAKLRATVDDLTRQLAEVRAQLSGALMFADRIGKGAAA